MRATLPIVREKKISKVVDYQRLEARDENLKERQKRNYDIWHKAKELPPVRTGDTVWITDQEMTGKVVEQTAPRSHTVDTPWKILQKPTFN